MDVSDATKSLRRRISRTILFTTLAGVFGLVVGLGIYTFIYGQGYAYLLDDPKACMNCHVMRDQYMSWNKSSHHSVTTCNSCHTPNNKIYKLVNKMDNGFVHSLKFTTKSYNDPIRIRSHNLKIALDACNNCHGDLFVTQSHPNTGEGERTCLSCHRDVGHNH